MTRIKKRNFKGAWQNRKYRKHEGKKKGSKKEKLGKDAERGRKS